MKLAHRFQTLANSRSPGRFYASVATKLILAHVLEYFDCSLVDDSVKTWNSWRSYVLPGENVLMRFSPRQNGEV